jgi:hypothetical protein
MPFIFRLATDILTSAHAPRPFAEEQKPQHYRAGGNDEE